MARQRQWYEDVMDVALRATLKEFGFKRKSRTNYVCEHSPERVWIFEIEPWSQHHPFRDWSGIFVPEIESVITRIAPQIGTYNTLLRHPSQFKTSIIDLVKISHGWDQPTWDKNPKSRHWLWGRRNPPSISKEIPLWNGSWWHTHHVKEVLARRRSAREYVMRSIEMDDREPWERDQQETAKAVGAELDALWRKHAHAWLQKCDDPYYLAQWFDRHIFSDKDTPQRHTYAATAAISYYVAGDSDGAANILNRLIAESETSYETLLEREQARDRSLELGPVLSAIFGQTPPPAWDAATRARASVTVNRKYREAANKIASGLGLRL
jgi:hypothetical protein